MAHPNEDLVREGFAAFERGDMDALRKQYWTGDIRYPLPVPGFTPARYDETIRQLEQAGAGFGNVPGRIFHYAMEAGGEIQVFDVWESREHFQKFAEALLPILNKLGVDLGEPQVSTVHNIQNR